MFASYHPYPYDPDCMVLDPSSAAARSPEGPSGYSGYLRELVEHHGRMPLLVSEHGVPSSRSTARLQPQGRPHAGHSETATSGSRRAGWWWTSSSRPSGSRSGSTRSNPRQHYSLVAMRDGSLSVGPDR